MSAQRPMKTSSSNFSSGSIGLSKLVVTRLAGVGDLEELLLHHLRVLTRREPCERRRLARELGAQFAKLLAMAPDLVACRRLAPALAIRGTRRKQRDEARVRHGSERIRGRADLREV